MLRRYIKDRLIEEFKDIDDIEILVDIILELIRDRYLLNLSLEYED